MRAFRSGCLTAAAVLAVAASGCGSSSKDKPASPSHKSAEGAMAGLLAAMKTGDNAQVAQWLSPTPASDRSSLSSTQRMQSALGLSGKLFWEVDKLTVKTSKESGSTATVTLSGPIVWCLGSGQTDAKASCAQPDGATGQAPVYKAVKQGAQWYIDIDINKGTNLPKNPAVSGAAASPSSSSGGGAAAKSKLQSLGGDFNAGQQKFLKRVAADAKAVNLAAVKSDVSQFRDVVFNFDADVRKIKFPSSIQEDVNKMLEGDRSIIAELDAMGAARAFTDFSPLFKRFLKDKGQAIGAINTVIHKL
ncbi:MAG: hypothetical protein QOJ14_463 [Thermoleophilaceae bacterium]|nr:hypothetical protein [Thermoleophilaceae bacterium]